jgi:hypothetical protein
MAFTFESAGPGYTIGSGVCTSVADDILQVRLDESGDFFYAPKQDVHETSEIKTVGDVGVLIITMRLAEELGLL